MATNLIQHIEWSSRQSEKLQAFYGRVFDWQFSDEMPGYTIIKGVGGIFPITDVRMPVGITPYVNVASLKKTEALIRKAGGRIIQSNQPVPGRGHFSLFTDIDGNLMAIWQAEKARPKKPKARAKAVMPRRR